MPARIVPYVIGLLQAPNITATFLKRQFGFSHDQLTRTLKKKIHWQRLVIWVIQRLFGVLSCGYLIIDDTTIAKPYAKNLEGASFVYSSVLEKTVYGYQVVLLSWSNGWMTLPLVWRFYQKGGASKVDLAQALVQELHDRWQLTPETVVFDSWYAAARLLDQLNGYGWEFVCQIKRNRIVNACRVDDDLVADGDSLVGPITGWFLGKVLRHEEKFFLTNQVEMGNELLLHRYGERWAIETVFRFVKNQLHLETCQARSRTAQETHLGSCILTYLILQKELVQHTDQTQTLYSLKTEWYLNRRLGRNRIKHYVKVLTA